MTGKKKINPKEEQKVLLNGASPDLADASMIRMFPTLRKQKRMKVG